MPSEASKGFRPPEAEVTGGCGSHDIGTWN